MPPLSGGLHVVCHLGIVVSLFLTMQFGEESQKCINHWFNSFSSLFVIFFSLSRLSLPSLLLYDHCSFRRLSCCRSLLSCYAEEQQKKNIGIFSAEQVVHNFCFNHATAKQCTRNRAMCIFYRSVELYGDNHEE